MTEAGKAGVGVSGDVIRGEWVHMAAPGETPASLIGTEIRFSTGAASSRWRVIDARHHATIHDGIEFDLEEIDPPHRCTCTRPGHGDGPCHETVDHADDTCTPCIVGC